MAFEIQINTIICITYLESWKRIKNFLPLTNSIDIQSTSQKGKAMGSGSKSSPPAKRRKFRQHTYYTTLPLFFIEPGFLFYFYFHLRLLAYLAFYPQNQYCHFAKANTMTPPPSKRQKRIAEDAAATQSLQGKKDQNACNNAGTGEVKMPKKKYYRQRAHANPFSDHRLD